MVAICLGLSMGCKKNDDNPPLETALQNEPPLSFAILNVPNGAADVDIIPTLNWESAKNPKGGEVTYDLYLDESVDSSTLIESDITNTSFELPERLHLLTDYRWKVIAKDAAGKTSQSSVSKFTTRNLHIPKTPVTAAAQFSPRRWHTSVVFDNKMWVIGGYDGGRKNDVWFSKDGNNWVEATANAGFSPRNSHSTVIYDNKIWVIGGFDGEPKNDVWYSGDGIQWTEATSNAAFFARTGHHSIVFDNKIWVIGGLPHIFAVFNDAWYSTDGANWEKSVEGELFPVRYGQTVTAQEDKIWLIGGRLFDKTYTDVWYSSDTIDWTRILVQPPFETRAFHSTVSYNNRLWVIGGLNTDDGNNSNPLRDIWSSNDGIDWKMATNGPASFNGRSAHTSVVFNNKIWVIGGNGDSGLKNDVWALD